jgi:cysteine desulfurase
MIYLDFAATSPVHPEVWETMTPYALANFGNPASQHELGQSAKIALEQARTTLLHLLGSMQETHQLLFTSGGTEANNLALQGVVRNWWKEHPEAKKPPHLVISAIEHAAVFEVAQWLAAQHCIDLTVLYPHPENEGLITPEQVVEALTPETILCSIMHANNETGVLQPIEAMVKAVKAHLPSCLFHCDMVQTIGKMPINLTQLPVDFTTASGHKFQAPKGCGFLVCSPAGFEALAPITYGGGQEFGLRPGTVSVANAVGLASALTLKHKTLSENPLHLSRLTTWLIEQLQTTFGAMGEINTPLNPEHRLAGIVNVSFASHLGEKLVLKLDLRGICVSSGSACHAGLAVEPSKVLLAMGKQKSIAESSIRVSMGASTTQAELHTLMEALQAIIQVKDKS